MTGNERQGAFARMGALWGRERVAGGPNTVGLPHGPELQLRANGWPPAMLRAGPFLRFLVQASPGALSSEGGHIGGQLITRINAVAAPCLQTP